MRKSSHGQEHEPTLEYVLSLLRFQVANKYIKDNTKVADLGCGYNGLLLRKVANRIKLGDGYDVSVRNSKLPKNITLKILNLNTSKFIKKNYYNHVTALAVLEHVEDPGGLLKLIKSMLSPNGTVIITTPHKRSKRILEFFSKVGVLSKEEIGDHKNYFDEKTLKNIFTKSGFKIIKLGTFEIGLNLYCVARKI